MVDLVKVERFADVAVQISARFSLETTNYERTHGIQIDSKRVANRFFAGKLIGPHRSLQIHCDENNPGSWGSVGRALTSVNQPTTASDAGPGACEPFQDSRGRQFHQAQPRPFPQP